MKETTSCPHNGSPNAPARIVGSSVIDVTLSSTAARKGDFAAVDEDQAMKTPSDEFRAATVAARPTPTVAKAKPRRKQSRKIRSSTSPTKEQHSPLFAFPSPSLSPFATLVSSEGRPKRKLKSVARFDPQSNQSSNGAGARLRVGEGFSCPRCSDDCSYDSKRCDGCGLECCYEAGVGVVTLKERRACQVSTAKVRRRTSGSGKGGKVGGSGCGSNSRVRAGAASKGVGVTPDNNKVKANKNAVTATLTNEGFFGGNTFSNDVTAATGIASEPRREKGGGKAEAAPVIPDIDAVTATLPNSGGSVLNDDSNNNATAAARNAKQRREKGSNNAEAATVTPYNNAVVPDNDDFTVIPPNDGMMTLKNKSDNGMIDAAGTSERKRKKGGDNVKVANATPDDDAAIAGVTVTAKNDRGIDGRNKSGNDAFAATGTSMTEEEEVAVPGRSRPPSQEAQFRKNDNNAEMAVTFNNDAVTIAVTATVTMRPPPNDGSGVAPKRDSSNDATTAAGTSQNEGEVLALARSQPSLLEARQKKRSGGNSKTSIVTPDNDAVIVTHSYDGGINGQNDSGNHSTVAARTSGSKGDVIDLARYREPSRETVSWDYPPSKRGRFEDAAVVSSHNDTVSQPEADRAPTKEDAALFEATASASRNVGPSPGGSSRKQNWQEKGDLKNPPKLTTKNGMMTIPVNRNEWKASIAEGGVASDEIMASGAVEVGKAEGDGLRSKPLNEQLTKLAVGEASAVAGADAAEHDAVMLKKIPSAAPRANGEIGANNKQMSAEGPKREAAMVSNDASGKMTSFARAASQNAMPAAGSTGGKLASIQRPVPKEKAAKQQAPKQVTTDQPPASVIQASAKQHPSTSRAEGELAAKPFRKKVVAAIAMARAEPKSAEDGSMKDPEVPLNEEKGSLQREETMYLDARFKEGSTWEASASQSHTNPKSECRLEEKRRERCPIKEPTRDASVLRHESEAVNEGEVEIQSNENRPGPELMHGAIELQQKSKAGIGRKSKCRWKENERREQQEEMIDIDATSSNRESPRKASILRRETRDGNDGEAEVQLNKSELTVGPHQQHKDVGMETTLNAGSSASSVTGAANSLGDNSCLPSLMITDSSVETLYKETKDVATKAVEQLSKSTAAFAKDGLSASVAALLAQCPLNANDAKERQHSDAADGRQRPAPPVQKRANASAIATAREPLSQKMDQQAAPAAKDGLRVPETTDANSSKEKQLFASADGRRTSEIPVRKRTSASCIAAAKDRFDAGRKAGRQLQPGKVKHGSRSLSYTTPSAAALAKHPFYASGLTQNDANTRVHHNSTGRNNHQQQLLELQAKYVALLSSSARSDQMHRSTISKLESALATKVKASLKSEQEHRSILSELESSLVAKGPGLTSTNSTIFSLWGRSSATEEDIAKATKERNELAKKLASLNRLDRGELAKVTANHAELAKVNNERNGLAKKPASLNCLDTDELANLTAERDELAKRLASATAKGDQLTKKLASLDSVIADRDKKLASVSAERSQLAKDLASVTAERGQLVNDLASLGNVIADRDEKLATAIAERGQLAKKLAILGNDLLNDDLSLLPEEVSNCSSEIEDLQSKMEEIMDQRDSAEEQVKELLAVQLQKDELLVKLRDAQERLKASEEARKEERDEHIEDEESMTEEIARKGREVCRLEALLQVVASQRDRANSRMRRFLQSGVGKGGNKDAENIFLGFLAENRALATQFQENKAQVAIIKSEKADAVKQTTELKAAVSKLQAEVETLRNKNSKLQDTHAFDTDFKAELEDVSIANDYEQGLDDNILGMNVEELTNPLDSMNDFENFLTDLVLEDEHKGRKASEGTT